MVGLWGEPGAESFNHLPSQNPCFLMEEELSSLDCFPCRCSRKVPESIQGLECRGSHVGTFGVMDEESRRLCWKSCWCWKAEGSSWEAKRGQFPLQEVSQRLMGSRGRVFPEKDWDLHMPRAARGSLAFDRDLLLLLSKLSGLVFLFVC